nr:MAG TPA: hypothetical protein [Caudoviricetes sp.]
MIFNGIAIIELIYSTSIIYKFITKANSYRIRNIIS